MSSLNFFKLKKEIKIAFFTPSVLLPPKASVIDGRHTCSDVQSEKHHIFSKILVSSLV